jgi:hypothetical protein
VVEIAEAAVAETNSTPADPNLVPGYSEGYKAGFAAGVDSLYDQTAAPSYVRVREDVNVYSRLPVIKPGSRPLILESLRHWEKLLYLYYHADLHSGMSVEDAIKRDERRQQEIVRVFHKGDL